MWYCESCQEYFDDADSAYRSETEPHPELGAEADYFPDVTTYRVCPYCGSDELIPAYECDLCGELHHEDGDICPECQRKIADAIDKLAFDIGRGDHKKNISTIATWVGENL